MSIIDQIKDRINCLEVAQHFGLSIHKSGDRCKSFRDDAQNNTSLVVYEDHYHDYSSSDHGDAIDLWGKICKIAPKQAMHEMAIHCKIENKEIDYNFDYFQSLEEFINLCHKSLYKNEQILKYIKSRGMSDQFIRDKRIGYFGENILDLVKKQINDNFISENKLTNLYKRIIIPRLKNGRVKYINSREQSDITSSAKYRKILKQPWTPVGIWGEDDLKDYKGIVNITEGVFNAAAIDTALNEKSLLIEGTYLSNEVSEHTRMLLKKRTVRLIADGDKSGLEAMLRVGKIIFPSVASLSIYKFSNKQDANEYWAENGNLDCFKEEVPFFDFFLEHKEDEYEVMSLLRQCYAKMDVVQWEKFKDKLSQYDDMETIIKIVEKPPSQHYVSDQMIKNHELFYDERIGWFKWNKIIWEYVQETIIKGWIADILGKHETGSLISSVETLLRTKFVDPKIEMDNQSEVITFQNINLNPKTKETFSHDKEAYNSILIPYEYDPKIECPNWQIFVEDITDTDENTQDLIQEVFGYCLTRDTNQQKSFFLIGKGSNGKSALLFILRKMLGEGHVSTVELDELNEHFQRISLKGKLVNLSTETENKHKITTSQFKKIVSGDPIRACHKNKDFIEFIPYCKMIFSLNEMINSNDISHGFQRRLIFIDFPITFVNDPKHEKQKKKDENILDNLVLELPGILNWAIIGLERLKKNGKFTDTKHHQKHMNDLIMMSSPIKAFTTENNFDVYIATANWHEKKSLYNLYITWCEYTNTGQVSFRKFIPELEKIYELEEKIQDGYISYKFIRTLN